MSDCVDEKPYSVITKHLSKIIFKFKHSRNLENIIIKIKHFQDLHELCILFNINDFSVEKE